MAAMVLLAEEGWAEQGDRLWLRAAGMAVAVWFACGLLRALLYVGDRAAVEGWNTGRYELLAKCMRVGRRSQQVLAVSLFTPLRALDDDRGLAQRAALGSNTGALCTQPGWPLGEENFRHSRLAVEPDEQPEALLGRGFAQVLGELVPVLGKLPQDRPLALLLEVDSRLPESVVEAVWQKAWFASGIHQSVTRVEGAGLMVVDQWLDQRINDQALLLVIAAQVAPGELAGCAEAVTGVLFGNRLTQTTVEPMAFLHRPQQEDEPTPEGLITAARQALDWVPVAGGKVQQVWITACDAQRAQALALTLSGVCLPTDRKAAVHDLDGTIGNLGRSAPWLAIAAAVDGISADPQPHFIFSGEPAANGRLWCAAVMPSAIREDI